MLKIWSRESLLKYGVVIPAVVGLQVIVPSSAYAQSTGGSGGAFGPLEAAVQMIVDFVTGPFGRSLAIIAVISLGFMAFAGRLSWLTAFAVVIGIGLVFGAPAMVDALIGTVGN